jgi:hypothetical protein
VYPTRLCFLMVIVGMLLDSGHAENIVRESVVQGLVQLCVVAAVEVGRLAAFLPVVPDALRATETSIVLRAALGASAPTEITFEPVAPASNPVSSMGFASCLGDRVGALDRHGRNNLGRLCVRLIDLAVRGFLPGEAQRVVRDSWRGAVLRPRVIKNGTISIIRITRTRTRSG